MFRKFHQTTPHAITLLRAGHGIAAMCLICALGGCGSGGPTQQVRSASNPVPVKTGDYGDVEFDVPANNQIVSLQTTLTVPLQPPASGTLFLWPGLQPDGANYLPIDNGVLQPVLTWGVSCAPGMQPAAYATWWVSAQYVNTVGKLPGYSGCYGGPVMAVNVGDALDMVMSLNGSVWTQTVTDRQSGHSVQYQIDLQGQAQNRAIFKIEGYNQQAVGDVVSTNTTISIAAADSAFCSPVLEGPLDAISGNTASNGGLACHIPTITLRSPG